MTPAVAEPVSKRTSTRAEQRRVAKEATKAVEALLRSLSTKIDEAPKHPAGTPMSAHLTVRDVELITSVLPLLPFELKQELGRMLEHIPPAPDPIPFRDFVQKAKPDYRWYWYGDVIHEQLMLVAEGKRKRLMIFAPPRHGKSELVSRLFTAYYQYRFPHRWVGLCSYGDDLAFQLARSSRANYLRAGGTLGTERDRTAVKTIETGLLGGMWAAGVGGPITGKGFHLGVIDDPLKNSEEAASITIRTKHKEWWQGTFYTRTEPNAAIVIIMTPWHEDDLANWLLRRETAGEDTYPERWHIVALDAIRDTDEKNKFFVPSTCTLEPDKRQEGEALCPERYPLKELLKKRQSVGAYYWSAMFQARPKPREGNMFKRAWFKPVKALPSSFLKAVRYWDIAGTDKKDAADHDPDYTRSVLMLVTRTQLASDTADTQIGGLRFIIAHANGGQMSPRRRDDFIVATTNRDAERFGKGTVVTWLERDPGGGGEERTKAILAKLAGHRARAEAPLGKSKELRAEPFRDQAEGGNVYFLEDGPHNNKEWWNAEFFDELCAFPSGSHDDYVDAGSGTFAKVSDMGATTDVEPIVIGVQPSAAGAGIPGSSSTSDHADDHLGERGGIMGNKVGMF